MNKPTKEELTALLQTWKLSCEKDCEKECNLEFKEGECEPCFYAIRSLVENMDKKVQDGIFIKHIQSHLRPYQKVVCKICGKDVETIVKENVHEVEEEKEVDGE